MNTKRLFLSSPTMSGHEMQYIQDAFDTNWIAPLGKNVDQFEIEISNYVGSKYAVALSSGTASLHLAIKLAGIKQGDIVLCSSLTFAATCNPILYEKAIPVFIDSEPDTWNMSPDALSVALKKYPRAKAVIVVNLYGTPAKLDKIKKLCLLYGIPLIEDAAESLGSTYQNKQTGTWGDYGIFSFNGNKIITTSGGGMLVSEQEDSIKKAKFWATQSREPYLHYEHKEIGYNYRMSNIVAGIGRGQLLSLNGHKQKKREIYNFYQNAFEEIPVIQMNPMNPEGESNNWLSCIFLSPKSRVAPYDIIDALEEKNIESRPIWKPMNLQPLFMECDFIQLESSNGVSVGENIFSQGLCLPSDIKNTNEDMTKIIKTIKGLF